MRKWVALVVASILMVTTGIAPAFAFVRPGTKAMGMGGAFTAIADDLTCVFWNPAGLVQTGLFDLDISIAAGGENIENIQNLYQLYQALEEKNYSAAEELAEKIAPPMGLEPTLSVAIGLARRFAISGALQADFSVETFNLESSSSPPYVEIEDVETALLPIYLSLAHRVSENLSLGLNLKYIQAARHSSHFKIFADGTTETISEVGGYSEPAISFDIGALYQKEKSPFSWGIMVENVVEPELNFPDISGELSSMRLSRSVNLGISLRPVPFLTLAADAHNLLTNDTTYHVGAEVDLKLIKLRAGFNNGNLTLGAGLKILILDLQATYYQKNNQDPYISLVIFKI